MLKLLLSLIIFSSIFISSSFTQNSFGFGDYDYISEWGSFGIAKAGYFSHPQFIGVGDDGSVFITDLGNKRVQKFSSNGDYMTEWGQSGKQPGEFHYPSGIAISDDSVFVADRDLNRIQKFSLDGEFILEWGKKGINESEFLLPNGIIVSNGIVYVADTGNQRVQMFSTDGEFLSLFGSSGLGLGQFVTIVGIDVDVNGNIYVTDKGNSKVEKFSASGDLIKSFPFYSSNYDFSPAAITVDPTGKMFVVNSANDRILHLSQDSDLKLGVVEQMGPFSKSFNTITDIAIGLNGELLVADSANHTIRLFETEFYEKPVNIKRSSFSDEFVPSLFLDKTKPVIVVPDSFEVEAVDFSTNVSLGNVFASDNNGIKTIINNAPDMFNPGTTTITWIAFDNAGNVSTDTQTISVKTCGNIYSTYNIIEGTKGDDVIHGTENDDLIFGLAGNDLILGYGGDDCIFGGFGDDIISGGNGNDTLKGNSGNDILKGSFGDDIIYGNYGHNVIDGENGNDRCYDLSSELIINCE